MVKFIFNPFSGKMDAIVDLSGYVPYTGATSDVSLGIYDLTATDVTATNFIIGANTLNATEWAYLDGQNQSVKTTSTPSFTGLTLTDNLSVSGTGVNVVYTRGGVKGTISWEPLTNSTLTIPATGGTIGIIGSPQSWSALNTYTLVPTGTGVNQGSIYINPASATANYTLLGIAVNGTQKFRFDADGDLTVASSVIVTDGTDTISILTGTNARVSVSNGINTKSLDSINGVMVTAGAVGWFVTADAATSAHIGFLTSGGNRYTFTDTSGVEIFNVRLDSSVISGSKVALATNATTGFLYIPTCAGTPTGTPSSYTGKVAFVYDTTNNKIYVYDGSWIGVNVA